MHGYFDWLKQCQKRQALFKLVFTCRQRKPRTIPFHEFPDLLVPRFKNHLSSFELGFLNIFRVKTCCVVCYSYCFCYSATKMARRNVQKKHVRFDFSQSENRKTIEKPSKGLPWNQQRPFSVRMTIVQRKINVFWQFANVAGCVGIFMLVHVECISDV